MGDLPFTMPSSFCPPFMTLKLIVISPAISIAPPGKSATNKNVASWGLLTERNLAVSLTEVQVTNTEFRTLDVDRQVHFRATAQILDIAVPAVLGPAWNCACSLFPNLLSDVI